MSAHESDLSRRKFLQGAGGIATSGVLAQGLLAAPRAGTPGAGASGEVEELSGEIEITLDVNGAPSKVKVEPRTTLLAALRAVRTLPPRLEYEGTRAVYDLRGQGLPFQRFVLEQVEKRWYVAE